MINRKNSMLQTSQNSRTLQDEAIFFKLLSKNDKYYILHNNCQKPHRPAITTNRISIISTIADYCYYDFHIIVIAKLTGILNLHFISKIKPFQNKMYIIA